MLDLTTVRSLADEALQNVSHNDEQIWREWVSLTEAASTLYPTTRGAIKLDRCLATRENGGDPVSPPLIEPSCSQNLVQTGPFDGIESLLEVKLENGSAYFVFVAAA